VNQKRQQYPLPGQIIVYCAAVEQTKSVAELLGCSAYYRDIGNRDAQYKRQILDRLILGQEQVFVATNALGLGIDRGSIRVVIHIGVPRQMRAYAQESGRAGRDGLVSEAIMMRPGKRDHGGRWVFPQLKDVEEDMRSFVETPGCRRVIIDHSMDGRENRMVCEVGEALCGNCVEGVRRHTKDPDHEVDQDMTLVETSPQTRQERQAEKEDQSNNTEGGTEKKEEQEEREAEKGRKRARVVSIVPGRPPAPPFTVTVSPTQEQGSTESHVSPFQIEERRALIAQQGRQEQQREEAVDIQQLARMLEDWHYRCPACVIQGASQVEHTLSQCEQREITEPIIARAEKIRQQIRDQKLYEKFAACRWCGIPQEICDRWERTPNGRFRMASRGRCQYRANFHIDVVMAVTMCGNPEWADLLYACIREDEGESVEQMVEADEENEIRWWCSKLVWGGMETSQLIRVFYRCVQMAERRMQQYR
jgi:superfamily II DNA helicase RecQ